MKSVLNFRIARFCTSEKTFSMEYSPDWFFWLLSAVFRIFNRFIPGKASRYRPLSAVPTLLANPI
jgi:hypothetical protein